MAFCFSSKGFFFRCATTCFVFCLLSAHSWFDAYLSFMDAAYEEFRNTVHPAKANIEESYSHTREDFMDTENNGFNITK